MWDVGRTQEEFLNHGPQLRILQVSYRHPKWFMSLLA